MLNHLNLEDGSDVYALSTFYNIKTLGLPSYLSNLISSGVHFYNTQNSEDVVTCHCRTDTF